MAKFVRASNLIKQFKQASTPAVADGLTVNDLWVKTSDNSLNVCTSVSPVTFSAVGGGGAVAESAVTFTDITTNDASTSKHGYLKKLPNTATTVLDGTGTFAKRDLVPISSTTISNNATVTITGLSTTYIGYKVYGRAIVAASGSAADLKFTHTDTPTISANAMITSPSLTTSALDDTPNSALGFVVPSNDSALSYIRIPAAASGFTNLNFELTILTTGSSDKPAYLGSAIVLGAEMRSIQFSGLATTNISVTDLKISADTGNLTSGTIYLYGIVAP